MSILCRALITISLCFTTSLLFSQGGESVPLKSDSLARDSVNTNPYYALDEYAKAAPEKTSKSLKELASYLEKKATSDTEKARLIYSWIGTHIHYDDKSYNAGKYPGQSGEKVLKKRTAVCAGYSSLFYELANLIGLKAEKISGYAKGYGYFDGQRVSKVNHDWNAVKIDGKWQLIDATWGSSESERTKTGLKSTMKFDGYWFLVPPEEFIFSHLPVDKKWQLVKSKITLKEYNNLPLVHESMFKMGFNAKEIRELLASNNTQQLVKSYSCPYTIKAIDIPFTSPLIKGQEYTFKFESSQIKRIALIGNARWIYLTRENNIFSGVFIPKSEVLDIAVSKQSNYSTWETILKYKVVEKK